MRLICLLAALACAVALSSCGGGGGTPVTHGPPSGTAASVFADINTQRTGAGKAALANNAQATAIAQAQANLNATNHNNAGVDAAGKTIEQRLIAGGVNVDSLITAVGFGNDTEVKSAWFDTPAELAQFNSATWTDMGVGMALDGGVQRWVVVLAKVTP